MTSGSVARSLATVLVIAMTSPSAEAQVCTGAAPFSGGHARIGIGGGRIGAGFGGTAGDPSGGVRLSLGATRGPFASMAGSIVLYDNMNPFVREGLAKRTTDDAGAALVSLEGGYGISVSAALGIESCPLAGFTRQTGPLSYDDCRSLAGGGTTCSGGVDGSGRVFWLGGGIGALVRRSPRFAFVPFAAAAYVSSQIEARGRNASDDYFEMTIGVGLVYRRLTIRPTLSFPIGLKQGSPSVGLELGLNLGAKS